MIHKTDNRSSLAFGALAILMLVVTGSSAEAQNAHLELYTGVYYSADDSVGEEEFYGVRGGYDFAPDWGVEISASQFEDGIERTLVGPEDTHRVRLNVFLLDLSFVWYPFGPDLLLFAGPGLADVDVEVISQSLVGTEVALAAERSLVWHAGLAYRWSITPGFYLRADLRGRSGDGDLYTGEDIEATLAAGWRF